MKAGNKRFFVRALLFVTMMVLLAVGALLLVDVSDEDVSQGLHHGSDRIQREAVELGRKARSALGETVKTINEESRQLRKEAGRLQDEMEEASTEQRAALEEPQRLAEEQVENVKNDTRTSMEELRAALRPYSRALRRQLLRWKEQAEAYWEQEE